MTDKLLGYFDLSIMEKVFAWAHEHDVEKGDICDARSGAINFYTRAWRNVEDRAESQLVGSIYVDWRTGEVKVEEETDTPLTRWLFTHLYDSIEAEKEPDFNLYKEELLATEKKLKILQS